MIIAIVTFFVPSVSSLINRMLSGIVSEFNHLDVLESYTNKFPETREDTLTSDKAERVVTPDGNVEFIHLDVAVLYESTWLLDNDETFTSVNALNVVTPVDGVVLVHFLLLELYDKVWPLENELRFVYNWDPKVIQFPLLPVNP